MITYLVNEVCEFTRPELIEMLTEYIEENHISTETIPWCFSYETIERSMRGNAVRIGRFLGFNIIKLHD